MNFDMIRNHIDAAVKGAVINEGGLLLGDLIDALSQHDPNATVDISGSHFGDLDSYRGYYDHLAIERGDKPRTVSDALQKLRAANGATFTGYKGGEFRMDAGTPVWFSDYGCCSGLLVTSVHSDGSGVHIGVTESDA